MILMLDFSCQHKIMVLNLQMCSRHASFRIIVTILGDDNIWNILEILLSDLDRII